MHTTVARSPGIGAASQAVLRGSIEVPSRISPNRRLSRIVGASLVLGRLRPKPKQDETTGQYLPNGGSRKAGLNKSILDAGWGQFQQICESKAVCAGSRVLFVSPKYTSQMCSGCGAIVQKELEERWHSCSCGCSLDRDHNAAKNILQLGLQALKIESRARTERSGDAPLRSPRL